MSRAFEELTRSQPIRPLRILKGHAGVVRDVAFMPDGQRLASGSNDKSVLLWEAETGRIMKTFQGHNGMVRSVACSPVRPWLASGSNDQTVRLWEVETGRTISILRGHTDIVNSVAFSPDGDWLASSSNDNTVRLWDVKTGQLISTLEHDSFVMSAAFAPDGRQLASGSNDGTVHLWEAETGRHLNTFLGHTASVLRVAFAPDGRQLASGSNDGTVHLWEAETGRVLQVLVSSQERVSTLAWSPNGEVLVSRSDDGAVYFWHVASSQGFNTLSQAGNTAVYWNATVLAFSPDGRLLATYSPDTLKALQLWDTSALDIGYRPINSSAQSPVTFSTERNTLLHTHLYTLPLCHVTARDFPSARSANWLRGAAAAGWSLPLALAHDLGLLLSQPAERRSLAKPVYLPFDEDTSAYLAFLQRIAAHPLVQELPSWQPPPSDAVLGILLARLVEGLALPEQYRSPSGPNGVHFVRTLAEELANNDPAGLWLKMPPTARPSWHGLLSTTAMSHLEQNLQALDREELRFLTLYGPPLLGSPDPRALLDLLSLTGLPTAARLALSQMLRLLPYLSAQHKHGGMQTYPAGGYEGLARQGSLESLLPSEMVYPNDIFLHRVLNHEALYYGRERPPEQRRELVYLVGQLGWGLGGDGQVLVRALLLALNQAMRRRGYEVYYSLAGSALSPPRPLDKPGEISRLLYAQERGRVDSKAVLCGVLEQLHAWRELYRGRQVLWVLGEDFDWEETEEHAEYYRALQAEGEQRVWYVRVGPLSSMARKTSSLPVTAHYFAHWQVVESGHLWDTGKGRHDEETTPRFFPADRH